MVGIQNAAVSQQCEVTELPSEYAKSYQVMQYFVKYMEETLIKGGDLDHLSSVTPLDKIYMSRWRRTKQTIVMCLSTGTVQVNQLQPYEFITRLYMYRYKKLKYMELWGELMLQHHGQIVI